MSAGLCEGWIVDGWDGNAAGVVWVGFFLFCWKGWGKGMFDVMWCGHWCYREGRKEGFKDCRLP